MRLQSTPELGVGVLVFFGDLVAVPWVSGPYDSDSLKVLRAIRGVILTVVSLAQAMVGSNGEKGVGVVFHSAVCSVPLTGPCLSSGHGGLIYNLNPVLENLWWGASAVHCSSDRLG